MVLDEQDLRNGLRFLVGTWQVDYVVNAFSNDLAPIPASEFKSEDGRDFSSIQFSFDEDHTMRVTDTSCGREEAGTWEQTDWAQYRYTSSAFFDIPDDTFRQHAETLSVQGDNLVFSLGFLAVGMKKIADGIVTETPDIGDRQPSAEDEQMKAIVGRYAVAQMLSAVGEDFGFHTKEDVKADLERRLQAGEIEQEEVDEALQMFDTVVEFTDDHRVISWMKLPAHVSEEDIREAVASGEIGEVKDGYFSAGENAWKAVDGAYYYDTGEHRELFGEAQSSWDTLAFDDEGLLPFGSGTMKLRRL